MKRRIRISLSVSMLIMGFVNASHARAQGPASENVGVEAPPEAPTEEPLAVAPDPDASEAPDRPSLRDVDDALRTTLRPGVWRIDAASTSIESAFTGSSLGEPWVSPIAVPLRATRRDSSYPGAPTAHSVLAQVSLGVSRRAEIGVRVCAIFCDPARATIGLGTIVRLHASDRSSVTLRAHASTFGQRLNVGSVGLAWVSVRGRLALAFTPELSFRAAYLHDTLDPHALYGAMAPLVLASVRRNLRLGGHVGAGMMSDDGRLSAVMPVGVDFGVGLGYPRLRIEGWGSAGVAFVVGARDAVDLRFALGMRLIPRSRRHARACRPASQSTDPASRPTVPSSTAPPSTSATDCSSTSRRPG